MAHGKVKKYMGANGILFETYEEAQQSYRSPPLFVRIDCSDPLYIPQSLQEINDMLDIAKAKVECFEKIKAIKERRK